MAEKPARKRAEPKVLESKTFKDGAIYLYRRADYKKPIWFIRIKVPGAKGYVWRSSRSTDQFEAYRIAEELYHQSLVKVLSGGKLTSKRISDGLIAYVKDLEGERDRLSVHYKILLAERLKPLVKGKLYEEVDTAFIVQLTKKLVEASAKQQLSPNTIKRLHADIRQFLNWSVEMGYLDKVPAFPKVSNEQARRPHFDIGDWRKLVRYLREHIKKAHPSVRRDRSLLANYVLVLANTGIRVGEAKTLKWRDVRYVPINDSGQSYNVVLTVKGKTGIREVVARTPAVRIYLEAVRELRREDLTNPKSDIYGKKDVPADGYVFCGNDGLPINSFKKSFATLLRDAGVEYDSFGQRRSLYSLRHTYATFRLENGVNQYILARNMGTSVAMLESFYGHTTNLASASELTKMR